MEGRSVLLAALPFQIETESQTILLSPSLKNVLLCTNNSNIVLFSLSKQSDNEHAGAHAIWTSTFKEIESALFSDDGKWLALLTKSQSKVINVYKITDQIVSQEKELFIGDTVQPFYSEVNNENVFDTSAFTSEAKRLVYLNKNQVVLSSLKFLCSYHLTSAIDELHNYIVNLPSDVKCFHSSKCHFYCLDHAGIIYMYNIESGILEGTYDVYKAVPRSIKFCKMIISITGSQVSLLGESNAIYILDMSGAMSVPEFSSHTHISDQGSSGSVSSFKTSVSKTSNYSRVESLRKEAITKKKFTSIANASSASTNWFAYLEKLSMRRSGIGKVEECFPFICIQDVPSVYDIRNLHFCQTSLGVWATHSDKTSDGFYRLYDTSSGKLESVDILAPDTLVVPLDSQSVSFDLFLQTSSLCLPLGSISRDALIQKMVAGGENQSVVDEMIGQAVLPLPLLQEGLKNHQIDMVRLALNLHTQGFKSKLSEEGKVEDELVKSTDQLFGLILVEVGGGNEDQWSQQVRRLALTNANILLSLLFSPADYISLQTEILNKAVLLRKGHLSPSVDLPVIPQWTAWLPLTDENVIVRVTTSSVSLVRCFLALHRGWTEEELNGDRFYNTVRLVVISLLRKKELEETISLLTKLKLDPEKELLSLCLECRDSDLRDYLVANTGSSQKPEYYEAWQFIALLESVLKKYNQRFSKSDKSPLKISDVLSLPLKEKSYFMADLYFSTGDKKLERYLEKDVCWDFLLTHNYIEGIHAWLTLENSDSNLILPMHLFSQWSVDQSMIDKISSTDCTDLTKLTVSNQLARFGMFNTGEKVHADQMMLRMALAQTFPDVKAVLDQETSNLNFHEFSNILLKHAIQHGFMDLAAKFNLMDIDDTCSEWISLFKAHAKAGKTWDLTDISQVVQETTRYLASVESVEPSLYLKQHPLVAIVTDTIKNQNICQMYSHVSPLLAVSVQSQPQSQDVTLYSLLAHTVPFHTDNIFHHQLSKKKKNNLPDFSSEKLCLRHGIQYSLGFKEFLKQGRPATAVSFLLQKGRHSIRRKAVVNCAHGLALYNALDSTVTSACVAFAELLGQDSTLLRIHIASAMVLGKSCNKEKLRKLLFQVAQRKEEGAVQLLAELDDSQYTSWLSDRPSRVSCLQQCHLAVWLSTCHNLPPPQALLRFSLETEDWLLFILVAQIFQFPLQMVQELCRSSPGQNTSKHLYHALQNNSRNQTEIGTVKMFEPETDLFACLAHQGNNAEVLYTLSRQLNSPALALLASSLQPLPVETGLCWWLIASLSPGDAALCPNPPWTPDCLTHLLEIVVKQGYFYTLAHGFYIYQPNPFCKLASFLIETVVERKESSLNLKLFMDEFCNLPNEDKKVHSTFLMSKSWVAVAAYRMACTALAFCFTSGYLRRCFLKSLCDAQFSDIMRFAPVEGQNLALLLRLAECLADTPLQLDWQRLCLQQDQSQLSELLSALINQHLFDTAAKYAQIAGLPSDQILVNQWSVLAKTDEVKERDFWQRCETAFQQADIDPQVAISFYRSQVSCSSSLHERYVLLKFALNWMHKSSATKEEVTSLQLELYMTCLENQFKPEVTIEGVTVTPLRCLSHELLVTPTHSPPQLTSSQYHKLDVIIHQVLKVGDIRTAFLMQALFGHTNQDCELLLACMHLAEGVASVFQLPTRIQEYLADDTMPRPKMKYPSPLPRMQSKNKLLDSDTQSILNALYTLQAHQTCTTPLFGNIICGFKIAVALSCDYKDVIMDPDPLNRLLQSHDFDVATSLLNLASLSPYDCTQYVCSQVVHLLNTEPENGKFVLWSCDLETEFNCILDLTGCPLLLGNLLMSSDLPLTETSEPSAYRQVVEALILAHSCYTRVCHMEGISSVLSLSRSLVNRLLDCCQWPLMVRLLTGINRYTEMNYIFQILKNNDQFEYLLGKGLDKQPQLMSATLEFVRRDKELFSLVAHHFSMYSELGALYEEEARAELAKLECGETGTGLGELAVCTHNTTCLQAAMSKYTDATEHYMQAKKMNRAVSSLQQAELIAVQLAMISNTSVSVVPCLVNLTKNQALQLVNSVLNCEQAHVVASAYSAAVDWSAALYQHCVLRGDAEYLQVWNRHHQLTKTLVLDIVHRFQNEKEISVAMESNMKLFVSSVGLLDVKYRVASQLGFKDILQSLLTSPDMAYLKDTVWQSGFKKQVF